MIRLERLYENMSEECSRCGSCRWCKYSNVCNDIIGDVGENIPENMDFDEFAQIVMGEIDV